MEIYEALRKDHEKVKMLFQELLSLPESDSQARHELIAEISDELIPHSRAEEAVFYNSIRAVDSSKNTVRHAYQEHMEVEASLRTLQLKDKIDADWRTTAQNLKQSLEHHIQEEETRIFAVARSIFTPEEAEKLGDAFLKMRPEVREEGFMGRTADLLLNLMPPRFTKALREKNRGAGLTK